MALMGFREYARHRNVSLRAVQKAIEAGRIAKVGEGRTAKIDSVQADRDWSVHTDPARQSLLHSARPGTAPADEPQADHDDKDDGGNDDDTGGTTDRDTAAYRAERALREAIRRQREQLELEQLRGELVAVQEVSRLQFTAQRLTRDRVEMVAARAAPEVLALVQSGGDGFAVERVLTGHLRQALEDAAKAIEDIDDDDDSPD